MLCYQDNSSRRWSSMQAREFGHLHSAVAMLILNCDVVAYRTEGLSSFLVLCLSVCFRLFLPFSVSTSFGLLSSFSDSSNPVCVFVCMCVCAVCMCVHVCMHVCVCMHVLGCVCVIVCVCVVHVCVCVCGMCVCVHLCVSMQECMYICVNASACACTHNCACLQ